MSKLAAHDAPEPSESYLLPHRRWQHELLSNLRGLPQWGDRLRLLREIGFPGPRYMLQSYGLATWTPAAALLPVLYLHRGIQGMYKVLARRK